MLGILDRLGGRFEDRWIKPCQFLEEGSDVEDEDAAVPAMPARSQVLFGSLLVRLLEESFDLEGALVTGKGLPLADIAIASVGLVRRDAEQHQAARRCNLGSGQHAVAEGLFVTDDVVG